MAKIAAVFVILLIFQLIILDCSRLKSRNVPTISQLDPKRSSRIPLLKQVSLSLKKRGFCIVELWFSRY